MADEIDIAGITSGWDVYAVVTTAAGLLTNGSATAVYSSANWDTYDVPLIEVAADSGRYRGDFSPVAGQSYGVEVRRRTGTVPNISTAVDPYLGGGEIGDIRAVLIDEAYEEIADSVWDELLADHMIPDSAGATLSADSLAGEVETGFTLKDCIRLMISFMLGKTSGGGTNNLTFRDINDTINRVVMTVDDNANRLMVIKNPA